MKCWGRFLPPHPEMAGIIFPCSLAIWFCYLFHEEIKLIFLPREFGLVLWLALTNNNRMSGVQASRDFTVSSFALLGSCPETTSSQETQDGILGCLANPPQQRPAPAHPPPGKTNRNTTHTNRELLEIMNHVCLFKPFGLICYTTKDHCNKNLK